MELDFTLDEIDGAAKRFISFFNDVKIIAFNGAMGAGKTTFIQAICRQMGVTDKMSSPTYPIINHYKTTTSKIINHIDIYRLKDIDEAIQAGVEDAINSGDFCFIEWPERIKEILPLDTTNIMIEIIDDTKRRLTGNLPEKSIFNS